MLLEIIEDRHKNGSVIITSQISISGWYFYRLDWDDPDQFSLYAVTEYIDESFDSSEEMKIFFEKYCELSFFYQGAETYMRVE